MSNFTFFGLCPQILYAIEESGYQYPTAVQKTAIPMILNNLDVITCAQTGTGKTAAFLIPALHRLVSQPQLSKRKGPRVVVLVPTRELAIQVADEAKRYCKSLSLIKTVCLYGGVPYNLQKKLLARPYDILVATPGRLIDLIEQRCVNISHVEVFILDEADRMLDMGFIAPVEKIASNMPKERQTLLFSATIDRKVLRLSSKLQNNPKEIRIQPDSATQGNISQKLYYVDCIKHKMELLEHLLKDGDIHHAILFTSTKRLADKLAADLRKKGYDSAALHGDINQRQRTRTIDKFRRGTIKILVATDVAARGLDVSTLTHVINFDLPRQSEDFIHRIGRTGRAGATGTAITFSTYQEADLLQKIGKLVEIPTTPCTVEGLEPKSKKPARPSFSRFKPRSFLKKRHRRKPSYRIPRIS